MTTKKYVLTIIVIAVLCLSVLALFFAGYPFKEQSPHIFYLFAALSSLCFLLLIVFIVRNHKKLIAYEVNKLESQINATDFSVIEISVDENILREKLKKHGYQKITENMFHKKVEGSDGPADHYYAAIFRTDEITDVRRFAETFDMKIIACNIGYIFLEKNVHNNLALLKEYIRENLLYANAHPYKRRKSFVPIVIADEKIFYLKVGSFLNEYNQHLSKGLHILQKNKWGIKDENTKNKKL